ncbi:hypothetical protein [Planotetraspora kaengkrachanensis]|uniref:Uncharacterized protein n=1 Tax=Planotetraspora kaengkrachanensis TaxID=575193 RepID=A0A8J3PPB9_9ACTN|nr:hypothetical protein [Planotetraspora kaengkrachanensis]GIG77506.1 hypothetical protein Pka01_06330 [Planotetraspora kaengkrachanensis]
MDSTSSHSGAEPADTATKQIILDLLKRAAAAHGVYEAEVLGGRYDEDWPQWYADHMARTLAEGGYRIVGLSG